MVSLLEQLLLVLDNNPIKLIKILTKDPLTFIGIEKFEFPEKEITTWQIAWAVDGPDNMKMISSATPYGVVKYIVENLGEEITSEEWSQIPQQERN